MCGRLQLGEEGGGERGAVWTLVQLDEVGSCRCRKRKGGRGRRERKKRWQVSVVVTVRNLE